MALVILPRSLAAILPGLPRRTSVEGETVAEIVAALDASWPGLADRILGSDAAIREHINVFIDGQRTTLAGELTPTSVVHIIPAVAGG